VRNHRSPWQCRKKEKEREREKKRRKENEREKRRERKDKKGAGRISNRRLPARVGHGDIVGE